MVERLAQVSVPVMADLCLIDIEDEDGQMRRMAAWHADPSQAVPHRGAPDPVPARPAPARTRS